MDPIFADSASETVTAELCAVATLLPDHCLPLLRTSCPTLEKQLIQLYDNDDLVRRLGLKSYRIALVKPLIGIVAAFANY
jgi:hypothetical protein